MAEKPRFGGCRQGELFPRSKQAIPCLDRNHRYVQLADRLDWDALEAIAQSIRRQKLKSLRGPKPHLRAMIGTVIFMGLRHVTYREAEDLIRHYTPARYLCGLTETDWTPDFTTIQDFTQLMGEDGIRQINEYAVGLAVDEKFAKPHLMVADTTAQEAAIPYPNEVGLLGSYLSTVAVACVTAGGGMKTMFRQLSESFATGKRALREYHLFAKTKEKRLKLTGNVASLVGKIQRKLGKALKGGTKATATAQKCKKVAWAKLGQIHKTMKILLPQVNYWLKTGFVAKHTIINLHVPELRAIPRGKVGKDVEFGLKWGLRRLGGGFVLGTVDAARGNFSDKKHAIEAVDEHIEQFGKPPTQYAYDRGGYCPANVDALRKRKVKNIALAPTGSDPWLVSGHLKDRLVKERARIEGDIGVVKRARYGFNKPAAKSVAMMGACGQRALLGYNLNKIVNRIATRENLVLQG